jgi:protein-tyrosine phosphatase
MPTNQEQAPLDVFWVRENQLMAGEYPGDPQSARARAKIRWLLDAGITTFVDLTEHGELLAYDHFIEEHAPNKPIEHVRMPIRDVSIPTVAEMERILDLVDRKLGEGQVVYLHCWGGVGRTGTVVGCLLVRHGMSAPAALDEIKRIRQSSRKAWRNAPETEEQRNMVRRWAIKQ